MKKRGQAAMEFLMTYGWAILIVLVALSTLFYLGIFDTDTKATWSMPSEISTTDAIITSEGVVMTMSAPGAVKSDITSMKINGVECSEIGTLVGTISQTAPSEVGCYLDTPIEDNKVHVDLTIDYQRSGGGVSHELTGSIDGTVEKGTVESPIICDNDDTCDSGDGETCANCEADCDACPVCGNTITEGTEVCDDGDIITETCGNIITETGLHCNAGCSAPLALAETCDDGNTANGDGCSSTCTIELTTLACSSLGAVAYWRFDEGTGTTTTDSINSIPLTFTGSGTPTGPDWGSTYKKGSYSLNFVESNGDYLVYNSDNTNLDVTRVSLATWVKTTQTTGVWSALLTKRSGSPSGSYLMYYTSSGIVNGWVVTAGGTKSVSGTGYPINDGNWHLMVLTYDGTNVKLYKDNAQEIASTPATGDIVNTLDGIIVGKRTDGSNYFNGIIDEAAIFNRALTPTEIQTLYTNSNAGNAYCT